MHPTTLPSLAVAAALALSRQPALAFTPPISASAAGLLHPSLGDTFTTTLLHARKSAAQNSSVDEEDDNNAEKTKREVNPAKRAALDGVLQRIERNYGRGSIVMLGNADRMNVDCVGTGSMTLGEL